MTTETETAERRIRFAYCSSCKRHFRFPRAERVDPGDIQVAMCPFCYFTYSRDSLMKQSFMDLPSNHPDV